MNVLLTDKCNGSCPYCFLKGSLVTEDQPGKDIAVQDFAKVLHYAYQLVSIGATDSLNLMGGEPTLHPRFEKLFTMAIAYQPIQGNLDFLPISVFTNGLFNTQTAELLAREHCAIMINVNHPSSYPGLQWSQIEKNISTIMASEKMASRLTLSFNIYRAEQDFNYLLELSERCGIRKIRADISRPSPDKGNSFVSLTGIENVMSTLVMLARECKRRNILLNTDCCLPVCSISDEQLLELTQNDLQISFRCFGGIDVTRDLRLWHCAPMRTIEFGRITDYPNAQAIVKALAMKTDHMRWEVLSFEKCELCKWRTLKICQGGCLSLKNRSI